MRRSASSISRDSSAVSRVLRYAVHCTRILSRAAASTDDASAAPIAPLRRLWAASTIDTAYASLICLI